MEHMQDQDDIEVALVLSNKTDAGVLETARSKGIETAVFNREQFYSSNHVLELLKEHRIEWVALAGFLWLVPSTLLEAFPGRIVNIHPALLPKYGGKGMYGMNVHRAVKEASEKESGITIHLIDERYDEGQFLFQASVIIGEEDSPEEIASKVLALEHQFFAPVLCDLIRGKINPAS